MEEPVPTVFPFAEFDPLLRRDLCAVLERVQRDLGIVNPRDHALDDAPSRDARLKARAISCLREMAEGGERAPDRLYEGAMRAVAAVAETSA